MSPLITKYLYMLCLLCLLTISVASEIQKSDESTCAIQQTCSQCTKTPRCVWCADPRFNHNNVTITRCIPRKKFEFEKDHWCSSEYVIVKNSSINILKNKPLSRDGNDAVQVQPQKLKVTLRVGEEQIIKLNYSKAEDYPVDLYYLMDLSYSMHPYKDKLTILGDKLAETMEKLTSNFRIGFGSFIDKVVLPMTDTHPNKLKSPCMLPNSDVPCASPYGFKNDMPLTDKLRTFKERVKNAGLSGNLDGPEGGFDAIMQALVCTENIGWREKARHILVFCTDDSYHVAGDGRLAGIVEPNDELCHLDKYGYYSYSLLQDYPSISQINRKAREKNVNVIFAVPETINVTYHHLSQSITGSSVGILKDDANNVVSIISKEYEKLVDSVTITDNAPETIDVRYFSKCLSTNSHLQERNVCDGVRYGDIVEFQIVIKAIACPTNPNDWSHTIKIGPRDLAENLELEIELICDCGECEHSNNQDNSKSSACRNNGFLDCGICNCIDGYYGKQCECKGNEIELNNFEGCRVSNGSEICSGRGTCKCGVCNCEKRINPQEEFYGTYCECDNFSCSRKDGLVCGGRGKCECGTCNCLPGWTGETCDCKESNSTCMLSLDSDVVCSGKGDCICGACHCHETENFRYSGQFCEECPTCPGQHCEELKDCVECLAYKSGRLWQNNQCNDCRHKLDIIEVDHVEEHDDKDKENNARVCRLPTDGGCNFVFKYELVNKTQLDNEKHFKIVVQKEKDCPTPVNVVGVAVGVIISTVVLGFLILMIWKILTIMHDRREYARFEKEKSLVRWERTDNPFYKKATTTFNNPTFTENSKS